MKVSSILLLPMVASAALLHSRQAGKQNTRFTYTHKELKPQLRANSKRTLTRIGPLTLLPGQSGRHGMSLDPNGQGNSITVPAGTFCGGKDCTIISGKGGLQFEDGTPADVSKGVYIHHILSSNNQKRVEPFVSRCDTSGDVKTVQRPAMVAAGFVGGSDDNMNEPTTYGTKDGKIEGGYWFRKGDSVTFRSDLVNLDKREKKVYLTYDLEYLVGHVGLDSQSSLISATGCAARRVNTSPKGESRTQSGKFRFFRDGYLVNGKGHLHDGGVAMDLFINGKKYCSSDAIYGGDNATTTAPGGKKWETIAGMTMCPGPIPIKDGDYMSLVGRYDLTKHPLRQSGNGMSTAESMAMWTMNFMGKASGSAGKSVSSPKMM